MSETRNTGTLGQELKRGRVNLSFNELGIRLGLIDGVSVSDAVLTLTGLTLFVKGDGLPDSKFAALFPVESITESKPANSEPKGCLLQQHPLPWRIDYWALNDEWHCESSPRVVDAQGQVVFQPPSNVGHPGLKDPVASAICQLVVGTVNGLQKVAPE